MGARTQQKVDQRQVVTKVTVDLAVARNHGAERCDADEHPVKRGRVAEESQKAHQGSVLRPSRCRLLGRWVHIGGVHELHRARLHVEVLELVLGQRVRYNLRL